MNPRQIEQIARAAHAANRALVLAEATGNGTRPLPLWVEPWERAEDWLRDAAIRAVVRAIRHPQSEWSVVAEDFLLAGDKGRNDAATESRYRVFRDLVTALASSDQPPGYMTTAPEPTQHRSASDAPVPDRILGYPVVVDPALTTPPIILGSYQSRDTIPPANTLDADSASGDNSALSPSGPTPPERGND